MDLGGIKREFFTIAVKEIVTKTTLLGTCANGRMAWFTGLSSSSSSANHSIFNKQARRSDTDGSVSSSAPTSSGAPMESDELSSLSRPLAYYLGLIVGLAAYNDVHVDVPFPPCIYKIIKGQQVSAN